jgi:hypothetical protein
VERRGWWGATAVDIVEQRMTADVANGWENLNLKVLCIKG